MSVQFGKCSLDGKPIDPHNLDQVRPLLAAYGPDGEGQVCESNFGILFRAFHTTRESRREMQPRVASNGLVLAWDGRMDNRGELIQQLSDVVSCESTDIEIVAAAYQRWGTAAFARLIGDWALSVWNPHDQTLVLAKDFVGARQLYYTIQADEVAWSTILDPLVQFANCRLELEQEYIAGWLAFFPAAHLTPYAGIHPVPPASFVRISTGKVNIVKYWDFNPARKIRYRSDSDYENHFLTLFAESVRRRLRSDAPVLAELSGGIDSSSIVCMADQLIANGRSDAPLLHTVSYYDDSEPNWDERPYFTKVEEKRGEVGIHIDVSRQEALRFYGDHDAFTAMPGTMPHPSAAAEMLATEMRARGNRVILSGIGGDEVTGGVPTGLPELQDLLARGRLLQLAQRLKVWALQERRPWFQLLWNAVRPFLPPRVAGTSSYKPSGLWLSPDFATRQRAALTGYARVLNPIGPLPSFQANAHAISMLRGQLGCSPLLLRPLHEVRYPYLDRDLLEFLWSIPREQIVRPGQRRSLVRRALRGIVPDELLNRRRKAFLSRAPLAAVEREWGDLETMSREMRSAWFGFVDAPRFREAMGMARAGSLQFTVAFWRTVALESWLRSVERYVQARKPSRRTASGLAAPIGFSAEKN